MDVCLTDANTLTFNMNNECINLFEEFSHFYCKMKLNSGDTSINSFAPGDFAKKHTLKLAEQFSGHYHAIKS